MTDIVERLRNFDGNLKDPKEAADEIERLRSLLKEREWRTIESRYRISDWQDIITAPRNGEDLLLYREDAGIFFGRWTAPIHILTERELERENLSEESANEEGWFFLDIVSSGRCDEDPTHWQPLPPPPSEDKGT